MSGVDVWVCLCQRDRVSTPANFRLSRIDDSVALDERKCRGDDVSVQVRNLILHASGIA